VEDFAETTVVVVGASGVFGGLMARGLIARGADVRLIVRRPDAVAPDLNHLPVAVADVTVRTDVARALTEVTQGQRVDGIVNCTGVVAFGSVSELSEEVANRMMAVNALGVLTLTSLASTHLNPGGFLTSFTGVAADMPIIGMGAYCASKAAAKMAMAVAARELRREKIRVIDVRAPHSETGLVSRALEGAAPKMPEGLQPLVVVDRVLDALAGGEKDLPAEAFGFGAS
jgi:NAD(P)-dependent dehydrogenase (short-subunit alcohol dehydrogenase family)